MIRAIAFHDAAAHRAAQMPGAIFAYLPPADLPSSGTLRFWCPCGCGTLAVIAVGVGHKPDASPSWEWNGRSDAATLSPSVRRDCGWHGWLRDGYWQEAGCRFF